MRPVSTINVRGIILAGTHQWSRSAFDRAAPRVLLPVAGSPLIGYALRWLRDAGVPGVAVCANSETRRVRQHLGDGSLWDLELSYYEDMSPRGPAGCVRDAALTWPATDVVVVEGTVFPGLDLHGLLAAHRESGAAVTVAARRASSQDSLEAGFESAGVYVFSRAAVQAVPSTGYQDIKEMLIPRLHADGLGVRMHEVDEDTRRVTSPSSYLKLNGRVLEWMACNGMCLSGYATLGHAFVHESATIEEGAGLYGPVLVGPNSRVTSGARVIGPAVIGSNCQVDGGAVVCRSVVWDYAHIGKQALVDRCVATTGVRIAQQTAWHAMVLDATTNGPIRESGAPLAVREPRRVHWDGSTVKAGGGDESRYRRPGRQRGVRSLGAVTESVGSGEHT